MSDSTAAARTPGAKRAGPGEYYFDLGTVNHILGGPAYSTANGGCVEGDRMIAALMRMPAGTGAEPHSHPNEQWTFILEGRAVSMRNGEAAVLGPGTLIYNPANAVHYARATPEGDLVFFTVKDATHGLHGRKAEAGVSTSEWEGRAAAVPPARTPGARRAGPEDHYFDLGRLDAIMGGPAYSTAIGPCVEGDRIICALMRIPAGTASEPHSHPNEQWIYILDGRFDAVIGGNAKSCGPGTLIYIPADTVHSGRAAPGKDVVFFTAKDASWALHGIKAA